MHDAKLEKNIGKLRKGATSTLSLKALCDVLSALGFSVSEKCNAWVDFHKVRLPKSKALTKLSIPETINGRHVRWDREGLVAVYDSGSGPAPTISLTEMEALRATLAKTLKEPGARIPTDKLVTLELGEIQTEVSTSEPTQYSPEGRWHSTLSIAWKAKVGRPQVTITAPDGSSFDFLPKDQSLYQLTDWLFKSTLVVEMASEALGLPTPEQEREEREAKKRDWTNTGTCACCGANVKMDSTGKLVLHGYKRPGYGYTEGSCFGVGYEPYERSTKGAEDYKAQLQLRLQLLCQSISELEAKETLPLEERNRLRTLKYQKRSHEFAIQWLAGLIQDWKPGMKMPEEIARERGWLE